MRPLPTALAGLSPRPAMAGHATALGVIAALAALGPAGAQTPPPYLDPKRPTAERVADLLGRMTLAEKIGQMAQVNATRLMGRDEWDRGPLNETWTGIAFKDVGVGSVLSGGGSAPLPNTPESWAAFTNELQRRALAGSRLKIPIVYGIDAVHGHNNVAGATIFPHNVGLAASFDPDLVAALSSSTARALRATGIHWNFAPVADLGRDPRWGRFYETFGEDPVLAGSLVAAGVRGLQSPGLSSGVAATVKHFLGYGLAEGGVDRGNALLPEHFLRETVLPPYAAGLAAGAAAVMANSGSVNGVPGHASGEFQRELLRGELKFGGLVVSDWEDIKKLQTVHKVAPTFKEAVRLAVNAGVDMYMVPHDIETFASTLLTLVREGGVPEARVNEAAGRVLALKFDLGLFEKPYTDAERARGAIVGQDRALARRAALASLTLLKNVSGTLPMPAGVTSIVVAGESANRLEEQMGGWTIGWQGIPRGNERPPGVTVLEGLRAAAPKGVKVVYHDGSDLAALKRAARASQYAVVVVGEEPYAEGEGDSRTLAAPSEAGRLVAALQGTEARVVLVMLAGRPLRLENATLAGSRAFLMAHLPGSEGGHAVADALFGKGEPGGRLPYAWPRSLAGLPSSYGGAAPSQAPLFPFGAGQGYASFAHGELTVGPAIAPDGTLEASLTVRNTGKVAGSDLVLAHASGPALRERRLIGFTRVRLEPGESRVVKLSIPAARLAAVPNGAVETAVPVVTSGRYELQVGGRRTSFEVGAR